jgi:hypothetical protein
MSLALAFVLFLFSGILSASATAHEPPAGGNARSPAFSPQNTSACPAINVYDGFEGQTPKSDTISLAGALQAPRGAVRRNLWTTKPYRSHSEPNFPCKPLSQKELRLETLLLSISHVFSFG